jgi:putative chitinase
MAVFGKRYFPSLSVAQQYHRQPEKIANHVYMDVNRSKRGALGNIYPGDGWKFRGRGIKQLTGRNNYEAFGKSIGMDADQAARYIATRKGALESACWFWKTNNIARYADADDIVGMSKRINGGTIGLEDRINRYNRAKVILGGYSPSAVAPKPTKPAVRTLRRGMSGPDVAKIQAVVGVAVDGVFGFDTASAVKKWQRANGLVADGIVGPATQEKMFKK